MVKLFVDANTLVSGLVFEGNERLLLDFARLGVCELVINEYVREEVREVLSRPHLGLSERERGGAMALLARCVTILEDPPAEAVGAARGRLPDKDDVPVLVGFERSGCDFLVTGDRDIREHVPKAITTRAALRRVLSDIESG
ncbi:MAG: hypothetical protein A3K65_04165 [Euryarchaeota archaeon RBG_16_68_12]|nr:MAG: hypothetical protein A3K65_04165 [Euryarchaeota archaeon RBG_16_68_12]